MQCILNFEDIVNEMKRHIYEHVCLLRCFFFQIRIRISSQVFIIIIIVLCIIKIAINQRNVSNSACNATNIFKEVRKMGFNL